MTDKIFETSYLDSLLFQIRASPIRHYSTSIPSSKTYFQNLLRNRKIALGQYLAIPKCIRTQVMLHCALIQNLAEVDKTIFGVKRNLN